MTGTPPHNRATNRHTGPMLFTDTALEYQYGLLIDLAGPCNGFAFKRELATGEIVQQVNLATVASNHLSLPLDVTNDDHWSLSGGVAGDGTWHIVGNNRAPDTTARYIRCLDVTDIEDLGNWESGGQPHDALSTGDDLGAYTYNIWDRMSDGTLVWVCSQQESAANARGFDFLMHKWNGSGWVKVTNGSDGHFVISVDTGDPGDGTANRAYCNGFLIEPGAGTAGADRFHAYGCFRTDNEQANSQGALWYIRSNDNGVSWTNITGTSITMPMTWAQRTTAAITSAESVVPILSQGICIDGDGYPHMSFDTSGDEALQDAFCEHWWDGAAWQQGTGNRAEPTSFHWINDALWELRRSFTGQTCMQLRRKSDGKTINMSHQVGACTPVPDPIRLREEGIFEILVPNGNDPAFYQFGKGHKATAN